MATPKRKRKNVASPAKVMELPGDVCKLCNKKCTATGEDSNAIQCEICYSWVHATCDGLSIEQYDLFNQLSASVGNIAYCCNMNQCYARLNQLVANPYGQDIGQVLKPVVAEEIGQALKPIADNCASLQESISQVSSRLEKLKNQYTNLEVKIKQLSENMESMDSSDGTTTTQGITTASIANIACKLANEEKEKEKRQLNLILHNVKESISKENSVRKDEDTRSATSILKDYLDVTVSITKCLRIGKKHDDPNKPRLLKITVGSVDEKIAVLRNKLRLRNQDNPEPIRKVFITADLTPLEQKRSKELRSQLAEMNKVANIYRIKNGEIVRKEK